MKHLHWYAHRNECCTTRAGRSVQGDIGTHTERGAVQMEQAEVYRVTLVRTQRGCCTIGAGRSVQVRLVRTHRGILYKWSRRKCTGYIGSHTQRNAVQMEQAEMEQAEGYIVTHTQRDAVQMEQAEVYRVTLVRTDRGMLYKWSRRKCTGLVHGHGKRRTEKERTRRTVKSRASPRDCFLFFRLDKVRVPYQSGSTSCEKCPLTCKDGLCGKIGMLCL